MRLARQSNVPTLAPSWKSDSPGGEISEEEFEQRRWVLNTPPSRTDDR